MSQMNRQQLELWSSMLAKSFHPSQWWSRDEAKCKINRPPIHRGGTAMWVYLQSEPSLFTVGYYDPRGDWHPDQDYSNQAEAAQRVHYLNGGLSMIPNGKGVYEEENASCCGES